MELKAIIAATANEADTLLEGVTSRKEARSVVGDALTARYPQLNAVDRQRITEGVMAILEAEDFFSSHQSGDQWSEDAEADDES